jgi:ubiquinol-cytochrome c reductase cytochrome b subunit
MLISIIALIHLISLHTTGSSNQSGTSTGKEKVTFHPFFSSKDLTPIILAATILTVMVSQIPITTADPENFLEANPLTTPKHIQPE